MLYILKVPHSNFLIKIGIKTDSVKNLIKNCSTNGIKIIRLYNPTNSLQVLDWIRSYWADYRCVNTEIFTVDQDILDSLVSKLDRDHKLLDTQDEAVICSIEEPEPIQILSEDYDLLDRMNLALTINNADELEQGLIKLDNELASNNNIISDITAAIEDIALLDEKKLLNRKVSLLSENIKILKRLGYLEREAQRVQEEIILWRHRQEYCSTSISDLDRVQSHHKYNKAKLVHLQNTLACKKAYVMTVKSLLDIILSKLSSCSPRLS